MGFKLPQWEVRKMVEDWDRDTKGPGKGKLSFEEFQNVSPVWPPSRKCSKGGGALGWGGSFDTNDVTVLNVTLRHTSYNMGCIHYFVSRSDINKQVILVLYIARKFNGLDFITFMFFPSHFLSYSTCRLSTTRLWWAVEFLISMMLVVEARWECGVMVLAVHPSTALSSCVLWCLNRCVLDWKPRTLPAPSRRWSTKGRTWRPLGACLQPPLRALPILWGWRSSLPSLIGSILTLAMTLTSNTSCPSMERDATSMIESRMGYFCGEFWIPPQLYTDAHIRSEIP